MQKNVFNVIVLPPEAEDSDSYESNVEDVAASLEEIFEPAGELEVGKTLRVMKNQKGLLYHQLGIKDFQTGIKVITLIKQF